MHSSVVIYRARFTLRRALFRKKCGALQLRRKTLFFLEKIGDFSSSSPPVCPCVSCQFSSKTGDLFLLITLVSLRGRPLFPACKDSPLLLCGPLFLGAPVRPNMLNMPKFTAGNIFISCTQQIDGGQFFSRTYFRGFIKTMGPPLEVMQSALDPVRIDHLYSPELKKTHKRKKKKIQ